MTVNNVEVRKNGNYSAYNADDCRKTGLPMLSAQTRYTASTEYMSKTQRARNGAPVEENETPLAWYRAMNGYIPLYQAQRRGTK